MIDGAKWINNGSTWCKSMMWWCAKANKKKTQQKRPLLVYPIYPLHWLWSSFSIWTCHRLGVRPSLFGLITSHLSDWSQPFRTVTVQLRLKASHACRDAHFEWLMNWIPSGNFNIANWKITIFNGNIHYKYL
jgi:hypothetical protein